MKLLKNDKISIIILTIIFLLLSIFFFEKTGNFLIDFSRELYIPYQLQSGEKPYSDIFLIYGLFGYYINSIILKLTNNIAALCVLAHIISYTILIIFYFILRKFLNAKKSFFFAFCFLTLSIFSNSTFSMVLPYSYSTLWAVLGSYALIFSVVYGKKNLLFLSLGFILINKIEFFIIFFPIALGILIYKKEKFLKNIPYLFLFPALNIIYIISNNIELNDIIRNFAYVLKMAQTDALDYFYKGMGAYFEINQFIFNLTNLFITVLFSYISYQFFKKEKIFAIMFLIIPFSQIHFYNVFNLIFLLIIISLLFLIKQKKLDFNTLVLFLLTFGLNLKCIFKTSAFSYSNFGFILALALLYIILERMLNKKWLLYFLIIYLIGFNIENIDYFAKNKKIKAQTTYGTIYLAQDDWDIFKNTNEYIEKNIKKDENLIVVPEGQIFNLINKKPWKFYNSTFTPLDFQTFNSDNIIKHLEENKTDYVIFYPRNTQEYGAKTICYNYGEDFCKYIIQKYDRKEIIEGKFKALIFKIKK